LQDYFKNQFKLQNMKQFYILNSILIQLLVMLEKLFILLIILKSKHKQYSCVTQMS